MSESNVKNLKQVTETFDWFGQSAFRFKAADKVLYIDPFQLQKDDKADIICITHSHPDHFSVPDIEKITGENTMFIAPADCVEQLKSSFPNKQMKTLLPGENTQTGPFLIEAVAAYNVKKTEIHPQSNNWVGYILTIDDTRIYHAGDTERIPEMKNFTCDIALIPLGQNYTMNSVEEAAEVVMDVQAGLVVPIHYGLYEGSEEDVKTLDKLLQGSIKVVVKEKS